jgi:two-component system sensor histidine kinase UhpB
MQRYLPSGFIPSRDPTQSNHWAAYDLDGQLMPPHEYPGARAMLGLTTVPGLDMRYVTDEGEEVWTRVAALPLRDEQGQVVSQVAVITDIDELKRSAEILRQSEASLQMRVADATQELRTLSRRLLLVQEEERRRLALELHDEIGQVLTGLTFQLAAAHGQNSAAAVSEANNTVQRLTEQVRQLALDLRPVVLDSHGLLAAVEWHLVRFQQRTGITVHLSHENVSQRYAPEVEIAAFRVVQEAMTNIARHADVSDAWVTLFSESQLLVVISDQGRGFNPEQIGESSGLGGMRERVELLGGSWVLEAAPGAGVHITAEFPLDVPVAADAGTGASMTS